MRDNLQNPLTLSDTGGAFWSPLISYTVIKIFSVGLAR